MKTLVIDTATRACSVALFDRDRVVASHHEVIGRGHAERLLPIIAELPERGRADRIVVNVGPGSFTGIRVGVAAARALGLAWDIPVSGYGCLALMAAIVRSQCAQPEPVDIVMSGGHGEYFFQSFDSAGCALSQAVSLPPAKIVAIAKAAVIAGDSATEIAAILGQRKILEMMPDAASWHLIADEAPLPASPVYGRRPDAKLPKGIAA